MADPFPVRLDGVGKRFDGGPPVLEGVSLSAAEGDFVSLIGPSGCGKSTLLRLVAGLTPPTQGRVEVPGGRAGAFLVFQDPNLLPWRRVSANVELPLELRGEPRASRRSRCRDLLELVGLSDAADRYPWQLSGGMRMRVSLARALSVSPRLLLLDEPFGALDEITRDRLNEDLLALRERDRFTALFVTHSVAEAVFLSTRIVVLAARPGRVARVIDVPFAYPRTPGLRESPDFLRILAETGAALRSVLSP
jgi:NitT/TauT family transport system ATP-binding protein